MCPLVAGDAGEAESAGNVVVPPIAIYCELDPAVRVNRGKVAALVNTAIPLRHDFAILPSPYSRINPGLERHGRCKSEIERIGDLDERRCSIEIEGLTDLPGGERSAALQDAVIAVHAVERVALAAPPTDHVRRRGNAISRRRWRALASASSVINGRDFVRRKRAAA